MIHHLIIGFNHHTFNNIFDIFIFVLGNIFANTINHGTILTIVFLELFCIQFSYSILLYIPILFIAFYLVIALEETYHIAMIFYLGKQEFISHIDITKVKIGFISFIGGVCVCYKGLFKRSEIFYISIAGPIMPVFYLIILELILLIIEMLTPIDTTILIRILLYSSIAPLSALIPISRRNYLSDGYRILLYIRRNDVSCKNVLLAIKDTIKSMIYFTVCSSLKEIR